ncbi:probable secreted beta-glucosidase SIM1 [Haliotis rufescens]|uniref:probable secreted beta-glucosidase SIM1 n=1 Tax=Haliotis rufescens TaxID=6454 RepID=UPI00201F74E3|nr:probable secreted beta-glucosidase SIM1 [Haliotis rufescens]
MNSAKVTVLFLIAISISISIASNKREMDRSVSTSTSASTSTSTSTSTSSSTSSSTENGAPGFAPSILGANGQECVGDGCIPLDGAAVLVDPPVIDVGEPAQ